MGPERIKWDASEKNLDKLAHKNSVRLLKSIFLECPLCGEECTVFDIHADYFCVRCASHKWKISFNIREI
jgi:hypothetical protein